MQDVVELRSESSWPRARTLRELMDYREVLFALAERVVRVRYKQTGIGLAWAILQPLAAAAIFAVVLGRFAAVPSEGEPYFLFALCGMAPWTYFSTATSNAMESVVTDASLIRKVYFPREVLPLAHVTATLTDLVPAFTVLLVTSGLYGHVPSYYWLALPLTCAVLVVIAAAVALFPAALNVYYRDVRYVLPFILQLGFFASAVVWPVSRMPSPTARVLWQIGDPVVAVIDSVRRIVLHDQWPRWDILAAALVWSCVLLTVSYSLFKRLERSFADRV